ncbi:PHD finger protein 14-like [Dendronephthya gigantea]|uniref:PHD finger protein 14-like n=1 Tax=Dendronephthya gigantea TaxID=151771 RepID=UPI00106D3170|nr:PHD finger protein 14-like [Dendronephthya gigantea]
MEDERAKFLNSILKRGPNKRRIKPAENNDLLQLALCYEDGSEDDDEDFQMGSDDEDDGSWSEAESDEEKHNVSQDPTKSKQPDAGTQQTGSQQTNNDENDDEDDTSDEDEGSSGSPSDKPRKVEDMMEQLKETKPNSEAKTPQKMVQNKTLEFKDSLKVLICGICLEDNSDEDDEIVECDNCGISVHESCFGIDTGDDANSNDSSDSESSTEPWFCDACKSGITPECELCPNLDGIFKETLRGQWVHLVCALYTPGITFDIPEKLEGVVLIDMPASKWGAKECNLCEDPSLSRTGVCIGCDAGLCKTFFHASCAQKKGLLSELPEEDDEDVADPLYAHCKLHLDKSIAKKKRQAYLTYVSNVRKFKQIDVDMNHKSRVEESLQVAREVYRKQREERTPPPAPREKVARSILSCPSVFRHLLKKAELLGFVSHQSGLTNMRRKWHIPAALTVGFVNYFYERGNRMKNMKTRLEESTSNNKKLQEEERTLRLKYEQLSQSTKEVTSQRETIENKCFELHDLLCQLAGKIDLQEIELPDILKEFKSKKDDVQPKEELKLSVCSKCEKSDNQHLMVDCDTCHSYYHLACVDPPLTRMPKKSSTLLWQCTECDSSSSEDEDNKVDPNDNTSLLESRQKRNIKEPTKFTPGRDPDKKKKRTYKRTKKQATTNPVKYRKVEKPRPRKARAVYNKRKPDDVRSTCETCGKAGDNSNLVRCDECKNCFHFGCLDPPTKTNPKPKGYSWYCTDCDDTPEEDSEDEETKEENKDERQKLAEQETNDDDKKNIPKVEAMETDETNNEKE